MPEDVAQPDIAKGCLRRVLDDWCPSYSGYHLYYPSRRQATPGHSSQAVLIAIGIDWLVTRKPPVAMSNNLTHRQTPIGCDRTTRRLERNSRFRARGAIEI